MKLKDIDDKDINNSSAAELEHKWQKKFHNICVLMGFEYGMLFLYNYGLFKIEYREVQLTKQHKSNKKVQWQVVGTHGRNMVNCNKYNSTLVHRVQLNAFTLNSTHIVLSSMHVVSNSLQTRQTR